VATTIVNRYHKVPFDVYIGRPSKFGNPFKLEHMGDDVERTSVVALYRAWIWQPEQEQLRRDAIKELRGKVLGCWCAPKPCHGDVLAEIADGEEP